jgi:RimJ/RimL family protein N-acetyltransferase
VSVPETIELDTGARLELLGPERAADVAGAINASLDHLRPWMEWAHRPTTTHEQAVRLALEQERFRAGAGALWTIVEASTGEVVGGCGLHARTADEGVRDIGYWLRPEATGRGHATAAAAALVRVAFDALGAHTVRITCDERNERSAAVAARLGFEHVATDAGSMLWERRRA